MDPAVGERVPYSVSGKTGVVRYVGQVDGLSGEWIGLELDFPDGKHNGELNGRTYFRCAAKHGAFVKKTQIKTLMARAASSSSSSSSSVSSASAAAASRRSSAIGTSSTTTPSRLQQMRDRRASNIGLPGSSSNLYSARSAASSGAGGSTPGIRRTPSSSASIPAAPSPPPPPPPAPSSLAATTASPMAVTASPSSRMSLDGGSSAGVRRSLVGRPPPVSTAPSEELMEARARITKLEQELEDRNRHVEQLNQNLIVLRESQGRASDAQAATKMEEDTAMEVEEGESVEAQWAAKVEAVRKEADEHVRTVRSELEEHLAQLQAEHEEVMEELRLENAAQLSDIKSLEAEVAQQKTRIAQFTTGEQKKAEEVALAVAKTSAGARKVETLEAQVVELQDMIETMTLEKETLEMDKEIADERVDELVMEVDALKASLALATASAAERSNLHVSSDAAATAEENAKLRAAVKALHDRSADEKSELNRKLRQLQRETTELVALREELEVVTEKKNKLESEVEELKELLDVANAYESMVEDLTDKNLTLGDKLADLEATVVSLESLKEMSEEMEHQHAEYEAELTNELETQRTSIQDLKQAVADQKTIVEDRDRTIARFRDATNRSREEINQLKAQLRAETGELESLKGATHSALNQTMTLRSLAASARENEAEAAKQRINADQARLENAFLRAAIPNSIFSDADQTVLRVRLRLGRITGKADILLQYLRKELDVIVQQDPKGAATSLVDSERTIQQLLLGEKLAGVSCQAKEDLFVLECHLTTGDEYNSICARLDSTAVGILESTLDAGLSGFADGSFFLTQGGDASVYSRLVASLDEWQSTRSESELSTEGFPMRSAVVKLQSRKSILSLGFSFSVMLTFIVTLKSVAQSPDTQLSAEVKQSLGVAFDQIIDECMALLKVAQSLYRRAEIDLQWSDEDLDGSVAVGGDVVDEMYTYADECRNLWAVVQEQLSVAKLQSVAPEEIVWLAGDSLLPTFISLKERLASLFKSACRGAFTDAVASRSGERMDVSSEQEGRPQWKIRAQAIRNELLDASTLRTSLNEMNELCQGLHTRVRELERADSQHRVVAQKLESEVLRLNDTVTQSADEKTRVEEQLARERDQFNTALEDSHKEKAGLDSANRELRKQLKRSSELGVNAAPSNSTARGKSALSQGDADAFRQAFAHLHGELHRVRSTLARERMTHVLGPLTPRAPVVSTPQAQRLSLCTKEVAAFSKQVKTQLSMPRMVDLRASSHHSARDQLMAKTLANAKLRETLVDLRKRISCVVQEDGWGSEVVTAIDRGETVFGWQPPEMERPPVLLSRVTLRPRSSDPDHDMEGIVEAQPTQPIPIILDSLQVKKLTQTLAC